jgi:hypothetical protein
VSVRHNSIWFSTTRVEMCSITYPFKPDYACSFHTKIYIKILDICPKKGKRNT